MADPFANLTAIPVGQDAENLALNVARVGAGRVGAFRVGFIGSPGDVADVHEIGEAGTILGRGYGWRDRCLPPHQNEPPTIAAPAFSVSHILGLNAFSFTGVDGIVVSDADGEGQVEQLDINVVPADVHRTDSAVMSLGTEDGITITAGADNSAHMTIRGTLAAINAALDGAIFQYVPAGLFTPTTFSLILTANDLGNTGDGGAQAVAVLVVASIT